MQWMTHSCWHVIEIVRQCLASNCSCFRRHYPSVVLVFVFGPKVRGPQRKSKCLYQSGLFFHRTWHENDVATWPKGSQDAPISGPALLGNSCTSASIKSSSVASQKGRFKRSLHSRCCEYSIASLRDPNTLWMSLHAIFGERSSWSMDRSLSLKMTTRAYECQT
jgi:hypothetical protein